MSQLAQVKITEEWESLEELIKEALEDSTFELDSTKTYLIQAQGNARACLVEPTAEPAAGSNEGVVLDLGCCVEYKKGTNTLYVRSFGNSWLNISVLGE